MTYSGGVRYTQESASCETIHLRNSPSDENQIIVQVDLQKGVSFHLRKLKAPSPGETVLSRKGNTVWYTLRCEFITENPVVVSDVVELFIRKCSPNKLHLLKERLLLGEAKHL